MVHRRVVDDDLLAVVEGHFDCKRIDRAVAAVAPHMEDTRQAAGCEEVDRFAAYHSWDMIWRDVMLCKLSSYSQVYVGLAACDSSHSILVLDAVALVLLSAHFVLYTSLD